MNWTRIVFSMLAVALAAIMIGQTAPAGATLTIKQGTFRDAKNKEVAGSGTFAAGARVWITAEDAPPDMAFDKWTGDTGGLSKNGVNEARTILTMPATNVTLTATYKENKSIRIACIGDTPTDMTNYPKELTKLLNDSKPALPYDVRNYGVPDSTIVQTEKPWSKSAKYAPAKKFLPHIVVFQFGLQDSQKGKNLDKVATFQEEYEKLIKEFAELETKPKIFVCLPPPIMGDGQWGMTQENLEKKVLPLIKAAIKNTGATEIDTYTPWVGHPELYHGNVHLTGDSKNVLAKAVFEAVKGK